MNALPLTARSSWYRPASVLRGLRTRTGAWLAESLPPTRVEPWGPGERDQARIRLAIGVLIAAYTIAYVGLPAIEEQTGLPGLLIPLGFLAYAALVFVWSLERPEPSAARRIIALLGDLGAVSYCLAVSGALGAPWYPIYLWVTFGNAIRFGLRYLYGGMVLSVIGFSIVIHVNEFWQENLALGWGLLAGLCVLPIYTAQLLRSLKAALVRAEEANRAKTRFLANMSHELRTPLNGVIAVGDMLAETRLSPSQRDMAHTIQTSAHALLGLIDQVLDISKIETDRLDRRQQPFDLHELIRRTAEIVRPQAVSQGLELRLFVDSALPYAVIGYPVHVRQILLNLLGNATKFTEQGHVALRVSRTGRIGKTARIRFEIADTGIGIPDEARSRVFEPFAQADESITRRYGGTGLGTTIAKQLVDLLGGQIRFESREGVGTVFRFELELAVDEHASDPGALLGMRVLAVGFGDVDLAKVRRCCREWGIDVSDAANPAAGDASAQPDAVIVDVRRAASARLALHERIGAVPRFGNAGLIGVGGVGGGCDELAEAGYLSAVRDLGDRMGLHRALHLARSGHVAGAREGAFCPVETSLHILLAEDNVTNQKVARMILEDAGHRVDLVEDGRAALALLEETAYDLAILDMHMPGMGGVEAVQIYRFARPESTMPFILLTADATTTAARMSEEAGIDAFLTKPVRPSTLRAAVLELTTGAESSPEGSPAPEAAELPAPSASPLDIETLDELAAMNARREGFLEDLVRVFLADADSRVRNMRRAIAAKDWHRFIHEAHRLKGAAGSVGAESLHRRCIAASRLSHDEFLRGAAPVLDAIAEECRRTRAALQEYLEARAPSSPAAPAELLRSAG